ncbi:MAG TPA: SRPBCC domain-containing protein [Kofleriaceae bacterium]|nr:SRPBCC domain-containing protein [Kofleriaceae bacterium]
MRGVVVLEPRGPDGAQRRAGVGAGGPLAHEHVVLHPHSGEDFGFGGVYREISDERVVQTESFDDYPGEATVTTTFTESGGRTTLRIVIAFDSQATRDIVLDTGMADGAGESYDALDEVFAGLAAMSRRSRRRFHERRLFTLEPTGS